MLDTRLHLLRNGMTAQFADLLAARYIRGLEDQEMSQIASILDLFQTKRDEFSALKAVLDAPTRDCRLNYQTLGEYTKQVNDHYKVQALQASVRGDANAGFASHPASRPSLKPVRPIRPTRQVVSAPLGAFGTVPFRSYGFVPRRNFSTDPNQDGKSKGGFFDFLKVMRRTDAEAAADPGATQAGATEEAG